jgi:hypothetical protein
MSAVPRQLKRRESLLSICAENIIVIIIIAPNVHNDSNTFSTARALGITQYYLPPTRAFLTGLSKADITFRVEEMN